MHFFAYSFTIAHLYTICLFLIIIFIVGVFLIPYFIIMIICGVPLLYMELAVGQLTGRGPIGAIGHLCPLLKGTTSNSNKFDNLP